jgi:Ca2+-binding EF-hand superfamily protein
VRRRLPPLCLLLAMATVPWLAHAHADDGGAAASDAVETTGGYLQRMDSDGDGRVSLAEYQAWMGYAFSAMDRNGDGVLSADELPGGRGKPITHAAHLQQLAQRFARQDANGDGWLSARELAAPPQ